MRNILFALGALVALFFLGTASAQNVMPNNNRTQPATAVTAPTAQPEQATGVVVGRDSKLIPGDEVSILVEEDREAPWKTFVTDTGDVDLGNLGSVSVAGKTADAAGAVVGEYLRAKYYKKATVKFQIIRKAVGAVRPFKVNINGKAQRPGPQFFTSSNPLKLSEAVTAAMPTIYSNLKKVQVTRGGVKREYDVSAILKEGRTDLDVPMQDGDQIYLYEKNLVFGAN